MLDEQTRTQLTKKFQQIKPQLKQHFSGLTDEDLQRGQGDPASLIMLISQRTGRDETQVEQQVKSLVSAVR